ncbi:MAG: DMT family transporter [Gemmatimonadota bacterium]
MNWLALWIAGAFEIAWAIGLKYTRGFTVLWPSVGTAAAMIASFVFLSRAVQSIPIGTAYAVWTGIGGAGTAILGIALFGESSAWPRLACIGLIIAGIAGLRMTAATP